MFFLTCIHEQWHDNEQQWDNETAFNLYFIIINYLTFSPAPAVWRSWLCSPWWRWPGLCPRWRSQRLRLMSGPGDALSGCHNPEMQNKIALFIQISLIINLCLFIIEVHFLIFKFKNGLRVSCDEVITCSRWKCEEIREKYLHTSEFFLLIWKVLETRTAISMTIKGASSYFFEK